MSKHDPSNKDCPLHGFEQYSGDAWKGLVDGKRATRWRDNCTCEADKPDLVIPRSTSVHTYHKFRDVFERYWEIVGNTYCSSSAKTAASAAFQDAYSSQQSTIDTLTQQAAELVEAIEAYLDKYRNAVVGGTINPSELAKALKDTP